MSWFPSLFDSDDEHEEKHSKKLEYCIKCQTLMQREHYYGLSWCPNEKCSRHALFSALIVTK